MKDTLKFLYPLTVFLLLLLPAFPVAAETDLDTPSGNEPEVSGLILNNNRFFRFNDRIDISFDLSLKKGFEQYLEYVVRIYDLNKHRMDVIINLPDEKTSELLIISDDKLSVKALMEKKAVFLEQSIHFDLHFDLKANRISFLIGDSTVLVANNSGLKPQTDYKIFLGSGNAHISNQNTVSALIITNIKTSPDLLSATKTNSWNHHTLYWILLIVWVDLLAFSVLLWKKNARKKRALSADAEVATEEPTYQIEDKKAYHGKKATSAGSIFLFGEFQVIDKNGGDISKKFTPLLKELFLILLFYSQKDSKGISASTLRNMLWMDKEQQSANNNRAVNIGKLKEILNGVGDYEIVSNASYLRIDLGHNLVCDYAECWNVLNGKTFNKQQIIQLIEIAGRGSLLSECSYEWLDAFKACVSDALIDTLLGFANMVDLSKEIQLIIRLSDTVFLFDPLNEEALNLKCKALIYSGKHSLAKATYTHFTKEYETLFSVPYKYSFSELTSERV
jgi:two-component SAPR family response regulator